MKVAHWLTVAGTAGALAILAPGHAWAATQVAVWHMDDSDSVMTDATGNGNTGAQTNVTPSVPGLQGTAYQFSGSPSVVMVRDSNFLDPASAPFSVTVHLRFTVRPSKAVGDYDVIRKGLSTTTGGDWKLEIRQDGRPYCRYRGSAGRVTLSKAMDLADGTWHEVTCARTASGIQLVVDGAIYKKSGVTGNIANTMPVFIGAKTATGGDQYQGIIDEVTISTG